MTPPLPPRSRLLCYRIVRRRGDGALAAAAEKPARVLPGEGKEIDRRGSRLGRIHRPGRIRRLGPQVLGHPSPRR